MAMKFLKIFNLPELAQPQVIRIISDELSKNKCWRIIGKEAYKITSTIIVTLLATIGAALVITTTPTGSIEKEKTTSKFNKVPVNMNSTTTGKRNLLTYTENVLKVNIIANL